MADRDELVLLTVPVEHGHADRLELEAPRRAEGDVVVEPAVAARPEPDPEGVGEIGGKPAVQDGAVGWAQEGGPVLRQLLRRGREVLLPGPFVRRFTVLLALDLPILDVLLAHSLEEVEALGVERCDGSEDRRGADAVREQRGRGERMRPAAGEAPQTEPLETERVADRGDVAGAVSNRAALVARRPAVAWPVVREEPDPFLLGVVDVRLVEQSRVGRAVVDEHGHAVRVTAFVHLEHASVRARDREPWAESRPAYPARSRPRCPRAGSPRGTGRSGRRAAGRRR